MKIRTKLTFNILLTIIVVGAVVATSIFGMLFIKNKLSYLTQKSTPYQMRTVEFQREMQGCVTDLVKVNAARNEAEYKSSHAEAEKTLESVKDSQGRLEEMSGSKMDASNELNMIARELFDAASARIATDNAATEANIKVSQRMKESSARLKELDKRIRNLQSNRSNAFATAMDDTGQFSGKLRSIEELRNLVKDLQLIAITIQTAQKSTTVLIAKGKINSLLGRITKNDYHKSNKSIAADTKAVTDKMDEFIKLQSAALTQKDDDSKSKATEAGKELSEKLNSLYLALDQETTLASEKVVIETNRQGSIYGQSNAANSILLANSELVALGLMVEGQTTRLFTLEAIAAIDKLDPEIRSLFTRINERAKAVGSALTKLGAKEELKILKSAVTSLTTINNELYAADGIVATLKKHLNATEQAIKAGDKLRVIVLKQAEKGKETVTAARGEQEKAIGSVNNMVKSSITLLIAIGIAAAVIGVLFGVWVFRSISKPLGQLIQVSDSVAGGNLHISDIRHSNDEFGQVQISMGKMVENLREMVGRISDSTTTVATSADGLSVTATQLEGNSSHQTIQIEQSVTSMNEMTQSIHDVSRNAHHTSESAGKMKQIALDGREALDATSRELFAFAEVVKQSVGQIEALGSKSDSINNVVDIIKDISDQTNLLALNASIEAARAGEMGRGFAVVADSVRQLARRSRESADEIAATVKSMQNEVQSSVSSMKSEREAIEKIVGRVDGSQKAMLEIVACVEQVFDMVQTIATSTEEQSATSEDINRTMHAINDVTRQVSASVNDIKDTSAGFARLADDLRQMVGWFRL